MGNDIVIVYCYHFVTLSMERKLPKITIFPKTTLSKITVQKEKGKQEGPLKNFVNQITIKLNSIIIKGYRTAGVTWGSF